MKAVPIVQPSVRTAGLFILCGLAIVTPTHEAKGAHTIETLTAAYEEVDNGLVFIVAHRGCWASEPENSIASLQACIRLGIEAVEIDVQLTRDREAVVFHDTTLNRMTPSWGYVADHTLAELQTLPLFERDGMSTLAHFRPLPTKHRIPSLRDYLNAARGRIMINLEIKTNHRYGFEETFHTAAELAREMGLLDHVFWKIMPPARGVTGTDARADAVARTLEIDELPYVMPMVWQSERQFERQLEDFEGLGIKGYELIAQDVDRWTIGEDGRIVGSDVYRYMGIAVGARWSAGLSDDVALVDPDAAWGTLLDLGFDLIMTDRPEQLMLYLEERKLR